MKVKINKKLLDKAIHSGCKTAAELALYLKMDANLKSIKVSR